VRVLLIQPSNDDLYNPAYWPPLGILYVAAALNAYGHEVKVVDMALDPIPDASYQPSLIGVSCSTPNYLSVKSIISICHQQWPAVSVVVGGPHVSILPPDGRRLGADITITGDGEEAMLDVAFKIGKGVKFHPSIPISHPVDVNVWPLPMRSTEMMSRYGARELGRSSTSLITARGCPYQCSYCCKWPGYDRVRYRDLSNIVEEIEQLKSMGYGSLRFFDDEINLNEKRLLELCKAIQPLNVEWTCLIRANLFTPIQASAMFDAGCRMVQVGVETGSDKILKSMNKRCTVENNTRSRKIAKDAGIQYWAFLVVGLPGESHSTIQDTRHWLLTNHPDIFSVYTFQPFPGTQIHDQRDGFDIQFPRPLPYDQFSLGIRGTALRPLHCLVSTSSLSSEEIVEARRYLDVDVRKEMGL
jgi:anaerobic magnesium-protoporphyrin IX monomethyl ester cyclase